MNITFNALSYMCSRLHIIMLHHICMRVCKTAIFFLSERVSRRERERCKYVECGEREKRKKIENVCKVNYFNKTCKHVNFTRSHFLHTQFFIIKRALFALSLSFSFLLSGKIAEESECKLECSIAHTRRANERAEEGVRESEQSHTKNFILLN
jgi:hypothetical protein